MGKAFRVVPRMYQVLVKYYLSLQLLISMITFKSLLGENGIALELSHSSLF